MANYSLIVTYIPREVVETDKERYTEKRKEEGEEKQGEREKSKKNSVRRVLE